MEVDVAHAEDWTDYKTLTRSRQQHLYDPVERLFGFQQLPDLLYLTVLLVSLSVQVRL